MLLQEILDLMDSAAEMIAQRNAERKVREEEEKKKMRLKKKGEDIRTRAFKRPKRLEYKSKLIHSICLLNMVVGSKKFVISVI